MNFKFYTIEREIIVILFFSYIYDAIRRAFISKALVRQKSYLSTSELESPNTLPRDFQKFDSKTSIPQPTSPKSRNGQRLKSSKYSNMYHTIVQIRKNIATLFRWRAAVNIEDSKCENDDDEFVFCPLRKMPKFMRIYQYISTTFFIYAFTKYFIVSVILYTKYFSDRSYSCYLPGRLQFVNSHNYELPFLTFVMVSYHIVYRLLWYWYCDRLDLDCFVFVICPESLIRDRMERLSFLNKNQDYRWYLKNALFYQQVNLGKDEHRYFIRESRSLDHLLKLKGFIRILTVFWIIVLFVFAIPSVYIIMNNIFSNMNFDDLYRHCRSFSGRDQNDKKFAWTFYDRYRLIGLALDGVDNLFICIDTVNAMIWPFTSSIICTKDLCIRLEALDQRLVEINIKLLAIHKGSNPIKKWKTRSRRDSWLKTRSENDQFLGLELRFLQKELTETFEQINRVDKFISIFSAFCIYVWVSMNFSYQVFSMINGTLLMSNLMVQFLQVVSFFVLTFTFVELSRAYNIGLKVHKHLCTTIALDPNTFTKLYWIWFLQYYNPLSPRFTLHIGHDAFPLSMASYLRSMVWFLSLGLLATNILRLELKGILV